MTTAATTGTLRTRPTPATTGPEPLARLRAAALVAGPLLLVGGSAVHPAESAGAARQLATVAGTSGRWWVAHVALMLGIGLLVPGLHALARRLDGSAPRLTHAGTVLAGVGALGMLALFATESTATWALSRAADATAAAGVLDEVLSAEEALFVVPVLAFHVGLLLLALALRRSPAGGIVPALALGAGSVLVLAGNLVLSVAVTTVGGALMAAVLVPVGLRAGRNL